MAWTAILGALASKMGQQGGEGQGPAFTVQDRPVPTYDMNFQPQKLQGQPQPRQQPYSVMSGMTEDDERSFYR